MEKATGSASSICDRTAISPLIFVWSYSGFSNILIRSPDVYKRQVQIVEVDDEPSVRRLYQRIFENAPSVETGLPRERMIPVSYTHLDVYKRQG